MWNYFTLQNQSKLEQVQSLKIESFEKELVPPALISLLNVTLQLFFLGKYSGPTQLLFLSGQLIGYVIAYDDFYFV